MKLRWLFLFLLLPPVASLWGAAAGAAFAHLVAAAQGR